MRGLAALLLALAVPALAQAPDSTGAFSCFGGEGTPQLIGGIEGLQRSIVYSPLLRRITVEGYVFVHLVVDETGTPTEVEVARSLQKDFDQAAVEAVRRARFIPGTLNGEPIRVRWTIPVPFRLR
jgi:protein TonB